tara:strand:- start:333 stop:674 length:342 start_codon:yes stop_codon:yes gene_type:complete
MTQPSSEPIPVGSTEAAAHLLADRKTATPVVLYTGDPVPGSAAALGIENMVNVKLTSKGLTLAKQVGVSDADMKYNLFLAIPNMNTDQINFVAETGGGFTCSRQAGGIIELVY